MATKPDRRIEYNGKIVHSITLTEADGYERDVAIVLKNDKLAFYNARAARFDHNDN